MKTYLLFILFFCFLSFTPTQAEALLYTGGSGRGDSVAYGANGDWVELESASAQTFSVDDATTAIAAITVKQVVGMTGAGINATDDIRITIPLANGLDMLWDTSDTSASISGTASASVSSTVSYEDGGRTLVIDVTTNFSDGQYITISGLSFTSFAGAGQDALDLEIDNAGTVLIGDIFDKTISLASSSATFTGGSGKGDSFSSSPLPENSIWFGFSF